jgi:hypothetical protein
MARLPRQAPFLTVLAYRFGPERELPYQRPLYFAFDTMNPIDALTDLRRCLSIMEVEYDCPLEALHIWHSGGRGFHGTIPPIVIGAEAGHPHLPRIHGAMIDQLFPPGVAPLLDRSIYSSGKGPMWRLPTGQRTDTKQYKVPRSIYARSYISPMPILMYSHADHGKGSSGRPMKISHPAQGCRSSMQ